MLKTESIVDSSPNSIFSSLNHHSPNTLHLLTLLQLAPEVPGKKKKQMLDLVLVCKLEE